MSPKLSMLLTALTTIAIAIASPFASPNPDFHTLIPRSLTGEATYYGGNVAGGTCSFSTYTLPSGLYGTALSDSNWDGSANCGGCVAVTGPNGKTITAMIVDQCPSCGPNHLDLFPSAFSALANPSTGIIPITWSYVKCPLVNGPLQIHMKSGVSKYWFSAQVVNGNRRTMKMEVSVDGGRSWRGTQRQSYNFFQIDAGTGTERAWVRVTSMMDTVVVVKDVPMRGNAVVEAAGNYA